MTFTRFAFAVGMLGLTLASVSAQSPEAELQRAVQRELAAGDLNASIKEYLAIVARAEPTNRPVAAQAQLRAAEAQAKQDGADARALYQQIVERFPDQADVVARARARMAAATAQSPAASGTNTSRLVWSGPEVGGRLSPDGRYLSFPIDATGDLGIRDLTTNTTRNLTNTGGWIASGDFVDESSISLDSRRIAYTWFVEQDSRFELRVMSIASGTPGAPQTVLRPDTAADYVGVDAWTPDGKLIVRRQQNKLWQIGIVSIEDGSYRSIKSLEWRNPSLSVSPDGRFIAYDTPATTNGSARDIYLLAIDGSSDTALVQHPANDTAPFWSPDGSRVLFVSDRNGTRALWSQAVSAGRPAGTPVAITPNPVTEAVTVLGMSRTGSLYYVRRGATRQNVYAADFDSRVVNPSTRRRIGSTTNANQGPAWSRDGRYLAYYSAHNPTMAARPPESTVVVRDVSTGVERVLPLPVSVENTPLNPGPKWFPGNRYLLILAREPQGSGLAFHRLDLETGRTEVLWRFTGATQSFDLSPDGKVIYCKCAARLIRYDIDSRREATLAEGPSYTAVAISPDGSQLASLKSIRENKKEAPTVIEVRPSGGGAAREVYRHPMWYDGSRYNTLAWTPDGRSLLFGRAEADTPDLWRVAAAGGSPQKIGLAGEVKTPAVRPGGKEIAFAMRETDDNEVWMIDNLVSAPAR